VAADIDQVMAERDALQLMVDQLEKAEDYEQMEQMLGLIQAQAAQLEGVAAEYGADMQAQAAAYDATGVSVRGKTEVLLTPEQRERVKEQTGVDMPSVILSDPVGAVAISMPETAPAIIEAEAIKVAEEFNRMVAAQAAAWEAIQEALEALEDVDNPDLQALIEKAKADPNFLAGVLAGK
jgi:hypothetical protein